MEKRIFRRVKKSAAALLALCSLALCACQPTPEQEVIVNKGDGALEQAIGRDDDAAATPRPYDAPERLVLEVEGLPEDYDIFFDAKVDVPDQTKWPVYSVEPAKIAQEQADAIRLALLEGAELYRPGELRSRAEIQASIDYYENELSLCHPDEHQIIEAYTGILRELYLEYESTPENIALEKADTDFRFMEDRVNPMFYGGKEVSLGEDSFRIEWTDEARQRAVAAGCESIYGVCWLDSGRKMEFSAYNGDQPSYLSFHVASGDLVGSGKVSYPLEEAIGRAGALLEKVGLDFVLADASTQTSIPMQDGEEPLPVYHALVYKRSIEGVAPDFITSCIGQGTVDTEDQSVYEQYNRSVPEQETIRIMFDDCGVLSFSWDHPLAVTALENPNVALLPFEKIQERIASQLKLQTVWDAESWSFEGEWIDRRRLEITRIKLSYLVVAKRNDLSSYYLIPVWNVCGDMYYHYIDSYPTGESNTFILDENNERCVWRMRYDARDYSIITINAIDGSAIDRLKWR